MRLSPSLLWTCPKILFSTTPPSQPSSHILSDTEAFNKEMEAVFGATPSSMDNSSHSRHPERFLHGVEQEEHQRSHAVSSSLDPPSHTPGTPVTITIPPVSAGQAVNIHLHFHQSVNNITVTYLK